MKPAGQTAHIDHGAQLAADQKPQQHEGPAAVQVKPGLEEHHQHEQRNGYGQTESGQHRLLGEFPEAQQGGYQEGQGEERLVFDGIRGTGQLIQAEGAKGRRGALDHDGCAGIIQDAVGDQGDDPGAQGAFFHGFLSFWLILRAFFPAAAWRWRRWSEGSGCGCAAPRG